MRTSLLKIISLLILLSCSTPPKEKTGDKYEDQTENYRSQQSQIIFKRVKQDPHKEELISAYLDFYAYSLRNSCQGLKYKKAYPGNSLLALPGLRYADIEGSPTRGRNEVVVNFFDLTNQEGGQSYEYFLITSEFQEWEHSDGRLKTNDPKNNLVLLKTGAATSINYVICKDKLGTNHICAKDKIIAQMADVNNTRDLCNLVKDRTPALSEDKLLYGIIELLVALEMIYPPAKPFI